MRVIDAVVSRDRAEHLEQRATSEEHRAVRLADADRVVLRITCEHGDPDEFLAEVRESLRNGCEDWEHYVSFEPLAIEPRPEDEEADDRDESVAGTEEIEEFVAEGATITRTFIVLSVVSGVLAAAGLLRGSIAVLVGAMVLAPLFKPLALAGVSVVLGQPGRSLRGLLWLAVSLSLAAGAALLVALLTPDRSVTSLIEMRTGISPFDVVVALAAGVAMAYVIVKRDSMAMVGIVVAASLMPVAAALGIAVALGRWDLLGGAAFTLASNVGGVLLGLVVGLRVEEIRTSDARRAKLAEWVTNRSLAAGSLVILALAGFSIWAYSHASGRDAALDRLDGSVPRDRVLTTIRGEDGAVVVVVGPERGEQATEGDQPAGDGGSVVVVEGSR
ncbi:MAG: TIGR00341 family protein [Phycisphaerales bacterium]